MANTQEISNRISKLFRNAYSFVFGKEDKDSIKSILSDLLQNGSVVEYSNIGTNGLPPLAVPGERGKLYLNVDTGILCRASTNGQSPYYVDIIAGTIFVSTLPTTGIQNKLYIRTSDNKQFRWSGSAWIEIGGSSSSSPKIWIGKINYNTTTNVLSLTPEVNTFGQNLQVSKLNKGGYSITKTTGYWGNKSCFASCGANNKSTINIQLDSGIYIRCFDASGAYSDAVVGTGNNWTTSLEIKEYP